MLPGPALPGAIRAPATTCKIARRPAAFRSPGGRSRCIIEEAGMNP